MAERKTRRAATTRKPSVDRDEPIKAKATDKATEVEDGPGTKTAGTDADKPKGESSQGAGTDTGDQSSTEATRSGAAGKGSTPDGDDADNAGGGDGVTGKTNDGATMRSNDGSTGTPNAKKAAISTKEGDAPQGVERDVGFTTVGPDGPKTVQQAAIAAAMPAGVLVAKGPVDRVHEGVLEVLRGFADLPEDKAIAATANIHEDLRIQRADVLQLASAVERKFGVDISPSEAQNFLLVRDISNLVLRKLARQPA